MDALSFWKLSYLFNQFRINCSQYFCFNIIIVNKRTKRFSLLWANPKSVFLRENLPELYFCFNFHLEAGLWCWHEALRGLKRGGDYQGERKKRTTGVCVCVCENLQYSIIITWKSSGCLIFNIRYFRAFNEIVLWCLLSSCSPFQTIPSTCMYMFLCDEKNKKPHQQNKLAPPNSCAHVSVTWWAVNATDADWNAVKSPLKGFVFQFYHIKYFMKCLPVFRWS